MQDKLTDEEREVYAYNLKASARAIEMQHIGNPIGLVASAYLAGSDRIAELEAEVGRLCDALNDKVMAAWRKEPRGEQFLLLGLAEDFDNDRAGLLGRKAIATELRALAIDIQAVRDAVDLQPFSAAAVIKEFKRLEDNFCVCFPDDDIQVARHQRDAARAAFGKYGAHTLDCWVECDNQNDECICGFTEAKQLHNQCDAEEN